MVRHGEIYAPGDQAVAKSFDVPAECRFDPLVVSVLHQM